ncbi:5-oxoprolinase subunit PxpB [Niallia sp. NCCP-28]|uniref:5-oxoprolinase subunit PxpB n=1 Tax=Niallia sp. NCCP-28 TaxID=2934712 RepID=UPI0020C14C88
MRIAAHIEPFSDSAILIEFGKEVNKDIHQHIQQLTRYLDQHSFPGFIEYIPAFTNVVVFYDPVVIYEKYKNSSQSVSPYKMVYALMEEIIGKLNSNEKCSPRIMEIPVCYGGEFGPDLELVASINKLTPEEVIAIHTSGEYLVHMIGFAPGFPFLGGMSKKIAAPRHSSPRPLIPPGSVGIAGVQTGVYPIGTPGGWNLIGRTPLDLFLPEHNPPSLLQAGDIVKFRSIAWKEYNEWKGGFRYEHNNTSSRTSD